jgi:HKD family nuclease
MMSTKRTEMRLDELRAWLSTAESDVLIISPYLTPDTLSKALSDVSPKVSITTICSWRSKDLQFGSSKIETYDLCKKRGWTLRVDHDGMSRTIHLKAYVVDGQSAMVGSANMTGRGMGDNIESLLPVSIDSHSSLVESIEDSLSGSILVDHEVYRQFREHAATLPDNPEIPSLTVIHGAMELEVLRQMPSEPIISDLLELSSIRDALPIRGLRFGEIRRMLRDNSSRGSATNTINDRTKELMHRIVESDSRFDIQKRYGTDCLVWKIHHILNEEIHRHLKPHIGKPLRDLGLDESLWDKGTNGSVVRKFCLSKLPSEIRTAISNLSTSEKSLRLKEDGKPLNPSQIGPRIVLTDSEGKLLDMAPEQMLPEDKLRESLWLPSFCVFEAPSGKKMGDALLLGFGLWETNHQFIQDMNRELSNDIKILGEQEVPFYDNPFTKERNSKVIFTKIGDSKGNAHLPLGHPDRKMSRYLTQRALTFIAQEILSQDH